MTVQLFKLTWCFLKPWRSINTFPSHITKDVTALLQESLPESQAQTMFANW